MAIGNGDHIIITIVAFLHLIFEVLSLFNLWALLLSGHINWAEGVVVLPEIH